MLSIGFDFTLGQAAIILVAYLFAATTKGLTGLGFSTTCLPILVFSLGLKDALPLVIIPSICSNLIVQRQVGHFKESILRFWPMLIATVPGLGLGLWVLAWIDGVLAGGIFGVVLLLWCGFSFAKPELRLPARFERPLAPISGFLTGMVNGATGSQVMPIVPFMMSLHLGRDLFIQGINCSFTMSSLVMAFGLGHLGLFSWVDIFISTLGISMVFLGLRLGSAIRHRLSEKVFRQAILTMLSLMGMTLLLPVLNF